MAQKKWTREEHVLAFNLYHRIPFSKAVKNNPQVIKLAKLIDRSSSAVAMKLGNFGRLDPALQARGITGLKNGAKGEEEVWNEFIENPEDLAYESEQLLATYEDRNILDSGDIIAEQPLADGRTTETTIQTRVNQGFFRRRILSAYDYRCCITGLELPQLLVASHIAPWSKDTANRLNARNGLCLNPFHDKAFDRGIMWIDSSMQVQFHDDKLSSNTETSEGLDWLISYRNRQLTLPKNYHPDRKLLHKHATGQYHRE